MKVCELILDLRAQLRRERQQERTIAVVPTMGNLHEGHLALVRKAQTLADCVVTTLFVNPLQFGPNEDFAAYPRTRERDLEKLRDLHVDYVFTPAEKELYGDHPPQETRVILPDISRRLCGQTRPHFFSGVATVVTKLFNIVQPDIAIFGEKDYQQLQVIKQLVTELNFPLSIVGVPTVREANGLAMSSRNNYLDASAREQASHLYRVLQYVCTAIQQGRTDYAELAQEACEQLTAAGLRPDYVAVCNQDDLLPPRTGAALIVLAAAYAGNTRLIDNLVVA